MWWDDEGGKGRCYEYNSTDTEYSTECAEIWTCNKKIYYFLYCISLLAGFGSSVKEIDKWRRFIQSCEKLSAGYDSISCTEWTIF